MEQKVEVRVRVRVRVGNEGKEVTLVKLRFACRRQKCQKII